MKISILIFLILSCYSLVSGQPVWIQQSSSAQVESPIAINPTNPDNIIATTISILNNEKVVDVFYSLNGGTTWSAHESISGYGGADPQIAFDQDGIAYLIYQIRENQGLYLHISNDGGATWSSRKTVQEFSTSENNVDRPWLAISPVRNSSSKFHIYVAYTRDSGINNRWIEIRRSTNGGNSFSTLSYTGQGVDDLKPHGCAIAVGIDNSVTLTYANLTRKLETSAVEKIRIVHSLNSDLSHPRDIQDIDVNQIGIDEPNGTIIKKFKIGLLGGMRVDSYPRISTDPVRGDFYITWANDNYDKNADIKLYKRVKQSEGNYSWQDKSLVISGSGEQFNPAISVSPDGVVSILYYSTSNTECSTPISTQLKVSTDGGSTFPSSYTLGESSGFYMNSGDEPFMGDYHGIASWFGSSFSCFSQNLQTHVNQGYNKRQIYFHRINHAASRSLPDNHFKVNIDQADEADITFGELEYWNQSQYTQYKPPYDFIFLKDNEETIKAETGYKSGTSQKFNLWEEGTSISSIQNHNSLIVKANQPHLIADFKTSTTASIYTQMLSGGTGAEIEFRDPWLKLEESVYYDAPYGYRNLGMDEAEFISYDDELSITSADPYKGVFKNHDPSQTIYFYEVRARAYQDVLINNEQIPYYFQEWLTNSNVYLTNPDNIEIDSENGKSYYQSPVVFTGAGGEVTAVYKGHLVHPLNGANTKNQRRVVSHGNQWDMVYEDGGDIWLTCSYDGGQTWSKEVRLNFNRGEARNPSVSNVFMFSGNPGDRKRYVITWLEKNTSGFLGIHLQTMQLSGTPMYGWYNYSDDDRSESYRILTAATDVVSVKNYARPVAELVQNGNNIQLYVAFEDNSFGINVGDIVFEGNGYNSAEDLSTASNFWPTWYDWILTPTLPAEGSDNPVLIFYPSVYGFSKGMYLYYREPDGSANSRIIQYNISDEQYSPEQKILGLPASSSSGVLSFQGAVSKGNGMVQLVAEVMEGGPLATAVYKKYPYYDKPYLYTNFTGMHRPSNMVENATGFANLYSEVVMRSYSSGDHWYKSNGSSNPVYFTSDAKGAYTRAQVPGGDRQSMMVKYSSPSLLTYYSGNGTLNKTNKNSDTYTISSITFIEEKFEEEKLIVLEFDSRNAELVDSLADGNIIAALRIKQIPKSGNLVYRTDSLLTPVSIELKRNNRPLLSLRASSWQALEANCLSDARANDVLIFSVEKPYKKLWGYKNITLHPGNYSDTDLAKQSAALAPENVVPEKYALNQNYPNPFNLSTHIIYDIPEDSPVKIHVYSTNGALVKTLVSGYKQAGRHNVVFDGSGLASGVYIYSIQAGQFKQVKRMLLLK